MTHGRRRGLSSRATLWLGHDVPHDSQRDESRYAGVAARLNLLSRLRNGGALPASCRWLANRSYKPKIAARLETKPAHSPFPRFTSPRLGLRRRDQLPKFRPASQRGEALVGGGVFAQVLRRGLFGQTL